MSNKIFKYPVLIKEIYLDFLGHMNNAMYLTLFEEARWEIINNNGYGIEKIKQTGLGPVILEIKINYLKEIRLREEIIIETEMLNTEKKISKIVQRMMRGNEICCIMEANFGLFDLKQRKLVMPTADWLQAIGVESNQA